MNSVRACGLWLWIVWAVAVAVAVGGAGYPEDALLNVTERAAKYGLEGSEHSVVTGDGYVVAVFRVRRAGGGAGGAPVLMVGGLLQSGAAWTDAGAAAPALLAARAGRDVWLANDRGSRYSRRHAALRPDADAAYWRFCDDEIGRYDLPATIDYVLSRTGARKLTYVGFSLGTTTFFIMCSEVPEYRDKIDVMIALAPAARHLHIKSAPLRNLAAYCGENERELTDRGVWEVLPHGGVIQSFTRAFCALSNEGAQICELFKNLIDAPNPGSISKSAFRALLAGFPAGTSVHSMAKLNQGLKDKRFQKFDYGPDQNLVRYGSASPPEYNLSAVTVPTVLIYATNDRLVDARDVKWLVARLPNVLEAYVIKDPHWSHLDFQLSRNIPKLLFPKIEEYLDKYHNTRGVVVGSTT